MQRFDQLPYGELVRNSWGEVAKGEGGIARNTIHIPLQQNGRKQPLSRLCRQLPLTGEPNSADTTPVSRSDSGGVPPPGADEKSVQNQRYSEADAPASPLRMAARSESALLEYP